MNSDYAATAFYRLLPEVKLLKNVEGEAAQRLQQCFSPGVIDLVKDPSGWHSIVEFSCFFFAEKAKKKNYIILAEGKQVAKVNNARYDICSRNVFRHEDLKDSVKLTRVRDHFICKYGGRWHAGFSRLITYFLISIVQSTSSRRELWLQKFFSPKLSRYFHRNAEVFWTIWRMACKEDFVLNRRVPVSSWIGVFHVLFLRSSLAQRTSHPLNFTLLFIGQTDARPKRNFLIKIKSIWKRYLPRLFLEVGLRNFLLESGRYDEVINNHLTFATVY